MKKFIESAQVVGVVFNRFIRLIFCDFAVFEEVFYVLGYFHQVGFKKI